MHVTEQTFFRVAKRLYPSSVHLHHRRCRRGSFPECRRGRASFPNEKLNIGVVGANGKGESDTDHCASENIVALCEWTPPVPPASCKKYPEREVLPGLARDVGEGESVWMR